jgi:hypothetical protein
MVLGKTAFAIFRRLHETNGERVSEIDLVAMLRSNTSNRALYQQLHFIETGITASGMPFRIASVKNGKKSYMLEAAN